MIHATYSHRSWNPIIALAFWLCALSGYGTESSSTPAIAEIENLESQLSREPDNVDLLFRVGRAYYRKGAEGDKTAVEPARKKLEKALELDAKHALARVVLGSVYTLKARDAFLPNGKMKWARRGVETMDDAVASDPDSREVRWIRALNNFHMPSFMKREELVLKDLEWLWSHRRELDEKICPQQVASFYGRALAKEGHVREAREVWEEGLSFDPTSTEAAALQGFLSEE